MKRVRNVFFSSPKRSGILKLVLGTVALMLCFSYPPLFLVFIPIVVFFLVKRFLTGKFLVESGDVILFFGLPGSGKSLFLSRLGRDNMDSRTVAVNEEFAHFDAADCILHRSEFGHYTFVDDSLILFDEGSLDGFDCRGYKDNFDEFSLSFMKKIRHYHSAIAFTNQGKDELDSKIRDNLCNYVYYCEKRTFLRFFTYCRASRLIKEEMISEITGQPEPHYRFPTFFERLFDPSNVLYAIPKIHGKHYSTNNPDPLPLLLNYKQDSPESDDS